MGLVKVISTVSAYSVFARRKAIAVVSGLLQERVKDMLKQFQRGLKSKQSGTSTVGSITLADTRLAQLTEIVAVSAAKWRMANGRVRGKRPLLSWRCACPF